MVSGAMRYWYRKVGDASAPACMDVRAGQMVFTPPMEEHAMEFTEDSVFINFANRQRDQASYEQDLVRVELIKPASAS